MDSRGVHDGHIVLLVPSSEPGSLAAELARDLGKTAGMPATVGSAGPTTGPGQLPGAYTEAGRCLNELQPALKLHRLSNHKPQPPGPIP
ncbi:hypothetical protein ABT034_23010 [Streptomyces sp. NPDC002773]|uniref:hypothetical protein n=1 Tax=Streptomyces sp. NPDC002773 TaxID=3154430 RepID=UPI003332F1A3